MWRSRPSRRDSSIEVFAQPDGMGSKTRALEGRNGRNCQSYYRHRTAKVALILPSRYRPLANLCHRLGPVSRKLELYFGNESCGASQPSPIPTVKIEGQVRSKT